MQLSTRPFLYPRGVEPENITGCNKKDLRNPPKSSGAESGADSAKTTQIDPDLAEVIAAGS